MGGGMKKFFSEGRVLPPNLPEYALVAFK